MTAMLRVPRSRAAFSGALLVLLGLWGALVPLAGPYFHFTFAPDKAWSVTSGRLWLQILPGAAVFLGGLMAMSSANRAFAAFGAWVAAVGGAWYTVGVPVSAMWATEGHQLGRPLGGTSRQVVEQLTQLYGLGVVAVFLAALALGRLAVVGVKDARLAEQETAEATPDPDADTVETTAPRAIGMGRSPVPAQRPGSFTEGVPPTPPDGLSTPRTSTGVEGGGDVKVAGDAERPGANA